MQDFKSRKIRYVVEEIKDQFLLADHSSRPWIIGFSGGKDSTALLTLVWYALKEIKDENLRWLREVHVVCNDTMVENPVIASYVTSLLKQISKAAVKDSLPIRVHQTTPRLEDSFWVNFIGRGYPVPNNSFRWCTERLKIKPTSRFIYEALDEHKEAIVLLGTRKSESATRAKSIEKHSIKGKRLGKHPTHHNAYIYSPIKELMLEEVWYIVNAIPSPWAEDNQELFKIYTDASADDYECPTVITSKDHKSCGQSRFGCWVCTVVKQDKSMTAQIDKGMEWMRPLLELRNALIDERNDPENRSKLRRDGTEAPNGMGTMSIKYKAGVLGRLLETQKKIQEHNPEIELISNQELVAIQVIWHRDLNFEYKVSQIYNSVYNKELEMEKQSERLEKEKKLLKEACIKQPGDYALIEDLLSLLKNKALLNRKRGLKEDLERRIQENLKPKSKTAEYAD